MSATISVPSAPWRSPYNEIEEFLQDLVAKSRTADLELPAHAALALLVLRADLATDKVVLDGLIEQADEVLRVAVDEERNARAAIMRSVGAS